MSDTIGRGVEPTGLAFGAAALGNLFTSVSERRGRRGRRRGRAGTRASAYFDTAPHYGLGLSERRLGAALRLVPARRVRAVDQGRPRAGAQPGGAGHAGRPGLRRPGRVPPGADFSRDGVLRSLEDSLTRLGARPHRHRLRPRPGRALRGRAGEALPGVAGAAGAGRDRRVRRRDEPGADAGRVRPPHRPRRPCWWPGATRCSTSRRSTSCCRCAPNARRRRGRGGAFNGGHPGDRRTGPRVYDYAAAPRSWSSGPGGSRRSARGTASSCRRRRWRCRWRTPPWRRSSSARTIRSRWRERAAGAPAGSAEVWTELVDAGLLRADVVTARRSLMSDRRAPPPVGPVAARVPVDGGDDSCDPIRRPYTVDDLRAVTKAAGVHATVLVQTVSVGGGDRGVPGRRRRPAGDRGRGRLGGPDRSALRTSWPAGRGLGGDRWPASGTRWRTSRTRSGCCGRTWWPG